MQNHIEYILRYQAVGTLRKKEVRNSSWLKRGKAILSQGVPVCASGGTGFVLKTQVGRHQ